MLGNASFLELERKYHELEVKYKDQQNINSELADKIQQLEFDKDMMFKENENLKKRAYDFQGLLEQSEVQAQIEFKEQELSEYKQKLEEERVHNQEYTGELREEIQRLKKENIEQRNNEDFKKKMLVLQQDNSQLSTKNQKYEKRIIELQQLLTKDSDKLTHAKEMEQMENMVKQMTTQLKKLKQEAHMKQLEAQK